MFEELFRELKEPIETLVVFLLALVGTITLFCRFLDFLSKCLSWPQKLTEGKNFKKNEKLINAICENDLLKLRELLENGADPNARKGEFLRIAVHNQRYGAYQLLIQYGADIHIQDDEAFVEAVRYTPVSTRIVEDLIARGANFNAQNGEPLIRNVKINHYGMVKLLLENGADVHARNDTALIIAVREENLDMVKMLLEHGADPNARDGVAFLLASDYKTDEMTNLLRQYSKTTSQPLDERLR